MGQYFERENMAKHVIAKKEFLRLAQEGLQLVGVI